MNGEKGREVVRTALTTLWGMVTLVLFFSVILLAYEMLSRGQDPLDFSFDTPARTASSRDEAEATATREILLYFTNAAGTGLAPERRRIEYTEDTAENCRNALEALIEGPQDILVPIISPASRLRGVYLLDGGELVVDFSRELEAGHIKSTSAELLMVQGIVTTLSQPILRGRNGLAVKRVRFLFEGSPPQDTFPAHINLSEPVTPQWTGTLALAEGGGDA